MEIHDCVLEITKRLGSSVTEDAEDKMLPSGCLLESCVDNVTGLWNSPSIPPPPNYDLKSRVGSGGKFTVYATIPSFPLLLPRPIQLFANNLTQNNLEIAELGLSLELCYPNLYRSTSVVRLVS